MLLECMYIYHGFFSVEASKGIAVETIIKMLSNKDIYLELRLQLSFVLENCRRLIACFTSLEATSHPLAVTVYNTMMDLKNYLHAGTTREEFGPLTDGLLADLSQEDCEINPVLVRSITEEAFYTPR